MFSLYLVGKAKYVEECSHILFILFQTCLKIYRVGPIYKYKGPIVCNSVIHMYMFGFKYTLHTCITYIYI